MIQIILDGEDPVYATYSWHWAGTTFKWEELETDDEHPHVYVGKGGHANWERGGVRFFQAFSIPISQGDITPQKADDFQSILPPVKNFSTWNDYRGLWGEKAARPGDSGPHSPQFVGYGFFNPIVRWSKPIFWSNNPLPTGWFAQANSPVNLSVKDGVGNIVGMHPDGSISATIPGVYEFIPSNNGPEYVTILTNADLTFSLEGTGDGTMDFFVSRFGANGTFDLVFEDVPITTSFRAELPISSSNPENALFVDTNGDGTFDQKFLPGVLDPVIFVSNSSNEVQQDEISNTTQGGGRRGSPGRGGSAIAADDSMRRIVQAAPPSLVVTGTEKMSDTLSPVFADVPVNSPYVDAVYALFARGIISGFVNENGRYFFPNQPVTIAEFSKMLCKTHGSPWDDVLPRTLSAQNDHWSYGYIARLELMGLTIFRDPLINVDAPITRDQAATMLNELNAANFVIPSFEHLSRAEAAFLFFSMLK